MRRDHRDDSAPGKFRDARRHRKKPVAKPLNPISIDVDDRERVEERADTFQVKIDRTDQLIDILGNKQIGQIFSRGHDKRARDRRVSEAKKRCSLESGADSLDITGADVLSRVVGDGGSERNVRLSQQLLDLTGGRKGGDLRGA